MKVALIGAGSFVFGPSILHETIVTHRLDDVELALVDLDSEAVELMAGVGRMRFALYALYSVVGGIVWTDGVLLLGHALGKVAWVRAHKSWIDAMVIVVVVLGLLPAAVHFWQGRSRRRV